MGRKYNIILEVNDQTKDGYIYLYDRKNFPQITNSEQLNNNKGININLDYHNDVLIGIEILDTEKNLDL